MRGPQAWPRACSIDERGSEFFDASNQFDIGLLYQLPIWQTLRPWLSSSCTTSFNNQPLVLFNTNVTPDPNSALDCGRAAKATSAANFGTARASDFPRATTTPGGTALYSRTVIMSFGIRF